MQKLELPWSVTLFAQSTNLCSLNKQGPGLFKMPPPGEVPGLFKTHCPLLWHWLAQKLYSSEHGRYFFWQSPKQSVWQEPMQSPNVWELLPPAVHGREL
jgi:hypothetical protein